MSEDLEISSTKKMNKKALGRGLGSLLREAASQEEEPRPLRQPIAEPPRGVAEKDQVWPIAIEKLRPNKEQPRKSFDPEKIQELSESIKEKGVMLPIVARKISENHYEIIAGERRWRAAQRAGLHAVPVILRKAENQEALELALIENIQRQDLLPLEEAEAYGALATRYGLTQQEIAQKVGKERSTVSNLLRLMGLAPQVKTMMREGGLPLGQAKVILALEDHQAQVLAAKKVLAAQLSVRATERLVAKLKETNTSGNRGDVAEEVVDQSEIRALKNELQTLLGTKVEVEFNGQSGRVLAHFYSVAELNQLVDKLRRSQA